MSSSDIAAEKASGRSEPAQEIRAWWPHPPLVRWIERWRTRMHDRRLLASLDDHALRDLGLDRAEIDTESAQSFWR